MLRKHGVVDKFVEFFGDGLANLPLADRATIGNMSPEFGSTCAIFPIDEETLRYLTLSGRPAELRSSWSRTTRARRDCGASMAPRPPTTPTCSSSIWARVEPSLAGPSRPQDRVPLRIAKSVYEQAPRAHGRGAHAARIRPPRASATGDRRRPDLRAARWRGADRRDHQLHQHLQSLRADRRRAAGAQRAHAWACAPSPGSRPASRPARAWSPTICSKAGLLDELAGIGFNLVGYGCTTCIGNSGPLKPEISAASRPAISSAARCCRAIATSTAACIPRSR